MKEESNPEPQAGRLGEVSLHGCFLAFIPFFKKTICKRVYMYIKPNYNKSQAQTHKSMVVQNI